MVPLSSILERPAHDSALLEFIKCHVTSLVRWNVLRLLADDPDGPWTDRTVAHDVHVSCLAARLALAELAAEGVIRCSNGVDGPTYALDGTGPNGRLLARLLAAVASDQALRRVIVARILEIEPVA